MRDAMILFPYIYDALAMKHNLPSNAPIDVDEILAAYATQRRTGIYRVNTVKKIVSNLSSDFKLRRNSRTGVLQVISISPLPSGFHRRTFADHTQLVDPASDEGVRNMMRNFEQLKRECNAVIKSSHNIA